MQLKGKHTEVAVVTDYGATEEAVELFALLSDTVEVDTDEQVDEQDYFGEELTQTTIYGGNPSVSLTAAADDQFANVENAQIIDETGEYNFSNRSIEAIRVLNYSDDDAEDPLAAVDAVGCEAQFDGLDFNEDGDVVGELVFHVNDRMVLNPDDVVGGD